MQTLPAATGVQWVREGFAVFSKQPMEFCTLLLSYVFALLAMMLTLTRIPVVGPIAIALLVPILNLAFTQAPLNAEQGRRVTPGALLTGFRSPQFRSLLGLSTLYLVAVILATAVFFFLDDGTFRKIAERKLTLESPEIKNSSLHLSMMSATAAHILFTLPLWFAGPLILWQKMPLTKAVFYSVFALFKSLKAFIVYGLIWLTLFSLARFVVNAVFALTNSPTLATLIWLPTSIILAASLCCSFYTSYASVFGKPEAETQAPAPDNTEA